MSERDAEGADWLLKSFTTESERDLERAWACIFAFVPFSRIANSAEHRPSFLASSRRTCRGLSVGGTGVLVTDVVLGSDNDNERPLVTLEGDCIVDGTQQSSTHLEVSGLGLDLQTTVIVDALDVERDLKEEKSALGREEYDVEVDVEGDEDASAEATQVGAKALSPELIAPSSLFPIPTKSPLISSIPLLLRPCCVHICLTVSNSDVSIGKS
ncbi:hypothetical protein Clacol_004239 [Clathrus columnatus]|uniref:Uncharacterized protein n=1 Tax=Clathrus columnatus TaxID=1419009 RepID=A0AAV5AA15_9AGAM|nr:hypothetical protein Clacol_004239 [Clathrus columnatus]